MGLCLIMGVEIVRRIDVEAKNVGSSIRRSDSTFLCLNFLVWYGSLYVVVANTSKDSFYILRFDRDAYNAITCEDSSTSFDSIKISTCFLRLCFRMVHHDPARYIFLRIPDISFVNSS